MKQKYTLSIADMQINVITEESRESVDKLVGILDRKMREITLNSKKCPKNEAALLCALEFCADKIALKEELEALDDRVEAAEAELQEACAKAEKAEQAKAKLEEEVKALRAMLEEAKKAPAVEEVKETEPVVEEIAPAAAIVEDIASAESSEKPAVSKKKSRNKVGSMFDLLTFSEI